MCDGNKDCSDGSDEDGCMKPSTSFSPSPSTSSLQTLTVTPTTPPACREGMVCLRFVLYDWLILGYEIIKQKKNIVAVYLKKR